MRKVIASPFVTLDGFMAGPQGEIDWNEPYFDEEMARYVGEQFASVNTLLFGRGTNQLFVQYWPTQGVKDDPVFAEKMNTLPKIVFSTTLETVTWNNARLVKENVAGEIQSLKRQEGEDAFAIDRLTNLSFGGRDPSLPTSVKSCPGSLFAFVCIGETKKEKPKWES